MGSITPPPSACGSPLHVVLFPFMSKGHTIPILHLSRLLLHRGATITLFTTPTNRPFISNSLSDTNVNIIELHFPENINGVPAGVESTDKLPSMSLFFTLATSTKLMKPYFEQALEKLPRVTFMITDGFLGWTLDSANKFNIPRLVYYGMNNFAAVICQVVSLNPLLFEDVSDDEPVAVPNFPWLKLTRNDFDEAFNHREPDSPLTKFVFEQIAATTRSYGIVVNSFHELEPVYANYVNTKLKPKSWCVGPFCLAAPRPEKLSGDKPPWIKWLDNKLVNETPVLYVAFGSQAEVSPEQLEEIKIGLERSEVSFLWVVRGNDSGFSDGFEERVRERGIVVREWVDQREILEHESVKGFLSHCGWNSVLESICAKVPVVAWPMMAEQHLNARLVVEEIKIGLRVETCDGSVRGFVKWEGLEKAMRELMEGKVGKEVRKKVEEVGGAAVKSVEDGGSSWQTLNDLIDEMQVKRQPTKI